jgi:hypothetical protein
MTDKTLPEIYVILKKVDGNEQELQVELETGTVIVNQQFRTDGLGDLLDDSELRFKISEFLSTGCSYAHETAFDYAIARDRSQDEGEKAELAKNVRVHGAIDSRLGQILDQGRRTGYSIRPEGK